MKYLDDKKQWDKYWDENKNKKTFFNSLVSVAREYYFAKYFARFISKNYDIKGKVVCEIGAGSGSYFGSFEEVGRVKMRRSGLFPRSD